MEMRPVFIFKKDEQSSGSSQDRVKFQQYPAKTQRSFYITSQQDHGWNKGIFFQEGAPSGSENGGGSCSLLSRTFIELLTPLQKGNTVL